MGAGAAGSLTGAAELFRFWVFPDCTFLDISIAEYIENQLKEDEMGEQLTMSQYGPFTGGK